MLIHQIRVKSKKKKRVGRGGKRGTYSGRGIKGQKARAGAKIKPQEREEIIKIPKRRGYRFRPVKEKPAIVNLDTLEKNFQENEIVSKKTLKEKGLIPKRAKEVKILGKGELTKKLTVKDCQMSKKVAELFK